MAKQRETEMLIEKMLEKGNHTLYGTYDDVQFIIGAALRYGIGRQSYAVGLIAKFIAENLSLLNEKWLANLLNDIKWYEEDRQKGFFSDADFDKSVWMNLKAAIRKEYESRGFEHSLDYHGLNYVIEDGDNI